MEKILDRSNYLPKTIENFEIISAYYCDIFYNHLYTEAKKYKTNGTVASITEGYKHTLNAFLKGLDNPRLYKKSITGIHHYYITIGMASISFSKCVDKLVQEFVPSDYFESLTSGQKMGILRMVISQSIKQFIKRIVDTHLAKIIDYHSEKDNVRILQDEFIDCLILERESMYARFIASHTNTDQSSQVNRVLVERMQEQIKKLTKEKQTLQKYATLCKKTIALKKEHETKYVILVNRLKKELDDQVATNQTMAKQLRAAQASRTNPVDTNAGDSLYDSHQPNQPNTPKQPAQPNQPKQPAQPKQPNMLKHSPKVNANNASFEGDSRVVVKDAADDSDNDSYDGRDTQRVDTKNNDESTPTTNTSPSEHTADNDDMANDDDEEGSSGGFIEVNSGNLSDIVLAKTTDLKKIGNGKKINDTIDEIGGLADYF
jgi:hypothetical protein